MASDRVSTPKIPLLYKFNEARVCSFFQQLCCRREGDGSGPGALEATIRAALQHLLRDIEEASICEDLPAGILAAVTTLEILRDQVGWRQEPEPPEDEQVAGHQSMPQNWCSKRWQPVVDLLLGWAPRMFQDCFDQLTRAPQEFRRHCTPPGPDALCWTVEGKVLMAASCKFTGWQALARTFLRNA